MHKHLFPLESINRHFLQHTPDEYYSASQLFLQEMVHVSCRRITPQTNRMSQMTIFYWTSLLFLPRPLMPWQYLSPVLIRFPCWALFLLVLFQVCSVSVRLLKMIIFLNIKYSMHYVDSKSSSHLYKAAAYAVWQTHYFSSSKAWFYDCWIPTINHLDHVFSARDTLRSIFSLSAAIEHSSVSSFPLHVCRTQTGQVGTQ